MSLQELRKTVESCESCVRLRNWCQSVPGTNLNYDAEDYWKRPVFGFGDSNAELLVLGLAPGAHGANRTGIPFTGDSAGNWLHDALFRHGFSNQQSVTEKLDKLKLSNVYITNVVKCAPPENKPNTDEYNRCLPYLNDELEELSKVKVILTLGEKAFKQLLKVYRLNKWGPVSGGTKFEHGRIYNFNRGPTIIASYHCSRYNTNTGRLTKESWLKIFERVKGLL